MSGDPQGRDHQSSEGDGEAGHRDFRSRAALADVAATHEEFPGCWRFPDFLAATSWVDGARTYESFLEPEA